MKMEDLRRLKNRNFLHIKEKQDKVDALKAQKYKVIEQKLANEKIKNN